ncbi:GNAT family N-acetyltransferase [Amycolatopsis umgeniensis]|uniref:GNAT superfamily N-acetyltransferase n=1 Tax=Amycolatopsis umgeniensis TaxID=336628 RepID=A0A841AWD1_9PSEU|nr:GNAT family N-acetyltransferase [Amycolatopsis umgeniensis]MBB5850961.1 GNAT superfamily N-acetyltransferase [Amycolatopsis umgeniensis]
MEIEKTLFDAHRARFSAIDRLLPEAAPAPVAGERVDAATAAGVQVTGVVQRQLHGPDDVPLLWSAADARQLFPFIGDTGTEGMDVLLRAWRTWLDAESPGEDSSCVVNWPSRDAEAIRAFLDHGLVPMSALAVRTGGAHDDAAENDVTVRRARAEDFEEVLAMAVSTHDYIGQVATRRRSNAAELLAPALEQALDKEDPLLWLAERDGMTAAFAHAAWITSSPGSAEAELLPLGRWGYVNNVVTVPGLRGSGLGRTLMAVVHKEFSADGASGTYLYYNPTNPLSSVFWHRQGYRPLWTSWEVHPASALR